MIWHVAKTHTNTFFFWFITKSKKKKKVLPPLSPDKQYFSLIGHPAHWSVSNSVKPLSVFSKPWVSTKEVYCRLILKSSNSQDNLISYTSYRSCFLFFWYVFMSCWMLSSSLVKEEAGSTLLAWPPDSPTHTSECSIKSMTGSTGRQTKNQIVTIDKPLNNNDRDEWEPTQTTQFIFSPTNKMKYVKNDAATIPG